MAGSDYTGPPGPKGDPGQSIGGQYRPDLQDASAKEAILGSLVSSGRATATAVPVAVQPTQVRRPWRSTARTTFQALVALAVLFPILVETAGLDPESFPWLAVPLAVAAGFARVMALPQVEVFLRRFIPFLAATPKES